MLNLTDISTAIRTVIAKWQAQMSIAETAIELQSPRSLGQKLASKVYSELGMSGTLAQQINLLAPFWHFKNVFDTKALTNTPEAFYPIPDDECTIAARASALALIAMIDMETISYKSENNGELFVNLVVIPGEGIFSEKSKKDMKGHTDAVSFPFRVQAHGEEISNISPAPDFVCLTGLRNPNGVPTTVLPLGKILEQLSEAHINELKKPQFVIRSQPTFRQGMKKILSQELIIDGGAILDDFEGKTWVRFSHSSVIFDGEEDGIENKALEAFKNACTESMQDLIIEAGDIVLINNRCTLHGRGRVGESYGEQSRWLLRSYGLNTVDLREGNRYALSSTLFP